MMRTKALFVVMLMTLVGGVTVTGESAGAGQEVSCKGAYTVTLAPGLGTEPVSDAVYHSGGESGKIDCGSAGTGTIGIDGRYGTGDPVNCASGGEGWGVFSYTYGGKTYKDTLTFDYGKIEGGFLSGRIFGERYTGTFTFTATEGDCVSAPVTKANVTTDGKMKG